MHNEGSAHSSRRPLPFHPLAVACFPILSLYSVNADSVAPGALLLPCLLASVVAVAVFGLSRLAVRDGLAAALATSLTALLFWLQSPVMSALRYLWPGVGAGAAALVALASLALLVAAAAWLRRAGPGLAAATRIANGTALASLVVVLATGAPALARLALPRDGAARDTATASAAGSRPDIYLIVLDAYGRADQLAQHFDFEDGLAERLRALGFYVADQSVSNYNHTATSIPSLLNFDYVPNLTDDPNLLKLGWLVRRNAVARTLGPIGYDYVACASGYNVTNCPSADRYLAPPPPFELFGRQLRPGEFELALLGRTPFEPWLRESERGSPYVQHRRRILHCLDALPRLAEDPTPTFAFAHLLAPHEPFVFGPGGEDVSPYGQPYNLSRIFRDEQPPDPPARVGPEYARRYRDQIRFVSDRVEQVVREILDRSEEPPIIIVQGDHGPYGLAPDVRSAQFPILNAYWLPGNAAQDLYPTITPVNTFRLVLRRYFGAEIDLLDDASWVEDPDGEPGRFVPAARAAVRGARPEARPAR